MFDSTKINGQAGEISLETSRCEIFDSSFICLLLSLAISVATLTSFLYLRSVSHRMDEDLMSLANWLRKFMRIPCSTYFVSSRLCIARWGSNHYQQPCAAFNFHGEHTLSRPHRFRCQPQFRYIATPQNTRQIQTTSNGNVNAPHASSDWMDFSFRLGDSLNSTFLKARRPRPCRLS